MHCPDGELLQRLLISSVEGIQDAAIALREAGELNGGFRVAPSHDIADKRTPVNASGEILAHKVFGWSEDEGAWWRDKNIALNSPITLACRFESEPFWINRDGIHTRLPNSYLDEIDLSTFEHRARTHAAIVVPVHLPFGQIGAVSFNPKRTNGRRELSKEFEEFGFVLGIYARVFISSYAHVMGASQRLPAGSRLSKREVECLRWAAIGKTDIEISMIIARSRATVRFHLHNAAVKLDAVNRSQTLFKAAQLGYISLRG